MHIRKRFLGMGAVATVLILGCASVSAETDVDTSQSPRRLTWKNYERVKELVALREGELTYQSVPWRSSVAQALNEAQAADKPLLLWLYFGGPRGAC